MVAVEARERLSSGVRVKKGDGDGVCSKRERKRRVTRSDDNNSRWDFMRSRNGMLKRRSTVTG